MLSIMRCCVQADGTGTNRNAGLRRYSSNIVLLIVALGCHFAWRPLASIIGLRRPAVAIGFCGDQLPRSQLFRSSERLPSASASPFSMSVSLPPPKRQKVYHGVPEPENQQASEEYVPHVVVQFVNDQDGTPLAPAVNLPANVTKDALESLVNKLKPQVSLSQYCIVLSHGFIPILPLG